MIVPRGLEKPNAIELKTEGGIQNEIQLFQVVGSISGIWVLAKGCGDPYRGTALHFVPEVEQ